ncbi:thiolase family protein [Antrihabitans sp. YC2-6]|uniref:thiolase family protein n=1 Tax=Antrihabitans sp. YC2-6 TaxID=2799498 RepID=UPI0018F614C4|nr:thiolase family protein [Antrihabitans sp. YC2-6]MBJ8348528.1 thiolase family protein [Antrihabitans sp. YC2-6]
MRDAVIVEAVRTPVGKGKPTGALHGVHPVDLFAHSLRAIVERTGIDPALIDDVIGGNVTQVDEQAANITRNAVLAAGYPISVPATTVDRQCGSSQQAVHFAAQGVLSGAYDIAVAGGVESMGREPMGSNIRDKSPWSPGLAARYPEGLIPQGISAELIASRWGISRQRMDEFALSSHEKAYTATQSGLLTKQLATLPELATDEGVRPGSSLETLAGLRPAYYSKEVAARFPEIGWNVTAANSSQLSDGSAAVMITTSEIAKRLGLNPIARLHSFAVVGDDPFLMLTAVIPATKKVLARAGLTLRDIDLFEVNEAFASVVLAWADETGADLDKVNVHGGALAIGHPLGASGARILTTMLGAMDDHGAKYALQTMCEAGGLSNAMIVERL